MKCLVMSLLDILNTFQCQIQTNIDKYKMATIHRQKSRVQGCRIRFKRLISNINECMYASRKTKSLHHRDTPYKGCEILKALCSLDSHHSHAGRITMSDSHLAGYQKTRSLPNTSINATPKSCSQCTSREHEL